jgi:hypothetical protein
MGDAMSDINEFALARAQRAASRLWSLGSAPFPMANGAVIQRSVEQDVTDTAIAFAIHVRRLLDNRISRGRKFTLDRPFRVWAPAPGLEKVDDLRDALDRIVHATEFQVGFERLPESMEKRGQARMALT